MDYLCEMHNKVNIRLNKTVFDCKNDLIKTYGGDCGCDSADEGNDANKTKNP